MNIQLIPSNDGLKGIALPLILMFWNVIINIHRNLKKL